jgi:hypothetical protein
VRWILWITLWTAALAPAQLTGIFSGFRDHPAIDYDNRPLRDPVSRLNQKLRSGEVQLKFDGPSGYLRSVLDALKIPVESQIAVFSKTSLQAQIIGPRNPRTIFFNDSVAVGWVANEPFVEIAAQDPEQGMIFYVLPQQPANRPQFLRNDGPCLQCHENYSTLGVPGTLVRSVYPSIAGLPYRSMGDRASDHRTPFAERWGGWYVSGDLHFDNLGNSVFLDPANIGSRRALPVKIDPAVHLSPYSDPVALMVFEHQMHLMNLLTRLGWEIRYAGYEKKPFDLASAAREVAEYMTFSGEPKLPAPVKSVSGFAEKFSARGPLYQFDLKTRLMRYPCSYMIYSEAFNALPLEARKAIYAAMREILSSGRLPPADAQAVLEILRTTKPDF